MTVGDEVPVRGIININPDDVLSGLLSNIAGEWRVNNESNAISALKRAFNYGRYLSINISLDSAFGFYSACDEVESIDPGVHLISELINAPGTIAIRPVRGYYDVACHLLIALNSTIETAFTVQNTVRDLDDATVSLVDYFIHQGAKLQCKINESHVSAFIQSIDAGGSYPGRELYDLASDNARNYIKYRLDVLRNDPKFIKMRAGSPFYDHAYNALELLGDVNQVFETHELIKLGKELGEKRGWVESSIVGFSSRGGDPVMSYFGEGVVCVDSRIFESEADARWRVIDAFFEAGRVSRSPMEMPEPLSDDEQHERCRERLKGKVLSIDPIESALDQLNGDLCWCHDDLVSFGFERIEGFTYYHPAYGVSVVLDSYMECQAIEVVFKSMFNEGYSLENEFDCKI